MILTCPPLNRAEALRYLGVTGTPPADVATLLDQAEKLLSETARPRYIWRAFGWDGNTLQNTGLDLPGEDIRRHLTGCHTAILLAVTLGRETEELFRRTQTTNMALAVTLDAAASSLVESCCDAAEQHLREAYPDCYITFRFSPGYGDLPLTVQDGFLRLLNAGRQIGLTVSPSNMLLPQKSVTAILGLSDTPLPEGQRGCATCKMRDRCSFRKEGNHCGF